MRALRWLLALAGAAFVCSAAAIGAVTFLSKPCTEIDARFDIAVVLGAGMDPNGTLHASTIGRVTAASHLWQEGRTAALHMTGGRAVPDGPAAGAQMKAYAIGLGIEPTRITHEDASLSTLQNALFSAPQLPHDVRLILVSEGFHLARGWLSFAWAGRPVSAVCHSTRLRPEAPARMLVREVAAFWFNGARAAVWSVLHLFGQPRDRIDALLA